MLFENMTKIYNPVCVLSELQFYDKITKKKATFPSKSNFLFDPNFATKCAGNIPTQYSDIYDYYHKKGITEGILVHPSQLLLWYPDAEIYDYNDKIIIKYNNDYYSLYDFHQKFFINQKLEYFLTPKSIIKKVDKDYYDLVIILHCGNKEIGLEIINLLIKNNLNKYLLAISYYNDDINDLIKLIADKFENYFIVKTNNFGNDITPSLITYYNLKKITNFDFIMKLHTKSHENWRNNMIIPLTTKFNNIINFMKHKKNVNLCCANRALLNCDEFCNDYTNEIIETKCLKNKTFCGGTCFISKEKLFNKILFEVPEKAIKSLFFFTFYVNNTLFMSNSPAHTFERLFGYMTNENEYNFGI
jgi:hypothetical protein